MTGAPLSSKVYFNYHDATFAQAVVQAPAWMVDKTALDVWRLGHFYIATTAARSC